eukprot:457051_1
MGCLQSNTVEKIELPTSDPDMDSLPCEPGVAMRCQKYGFVSKVNCKNILLHCLRKSNINKDNSSFIITNVYQTLLNYIGCTMHYNFLKARESVKYQRYDGYNRQGDINESIWKLKLFSNGTCKYNYRSFFGGSFGVTAQIREKNADGIWYLSPNLTDITIIISGNESCSGYKDNYSKTYKHREMIIQNIENDETIHEY